MCCAQNNASLSSSNGKLFKVIFGGKTFNEKAQAHVVLENIVKDTLRIELEFENKKKLPATLYLLEQGEPTQNKDFSYRVEFNDVKLKLVFVGVYDIRPLPDPLVAKKPVVDTSMNYKNKTFGHLFELKNGKPLYFNNRPGNGPCAVAMPPEYLDYTGFLISRAQVMDYKFAIVENVCRNNCLTVDQLNSLLKHIEHEIEKLKIVRLAYFSLVDPANKKGLAQSFRFEASVNELNSILNNPDVALNSSPNNCSKPASEMILNNFVTRLSAFGNDAERFEVFKKGYMELCYSVEQVSQILNKFIHDREKLEAAKLLYAYCVEKDKFMTVSEAFSYNQTNSELKDFIEKQR